MLFPASLSVDKSSGRTRQKVPPESRKRNPIACEQCRNRKIRCESNIPGEAPCRQCERTGHHCLFQEISPKVVVPKKDLLLLKERCEAFEKLILDASSEQRLEDIKVLLKGLQNSSSGVSPGNDSADGLSVNSGRSRCHSPFQLEDIAGDMQNVPMVFAHHGLENPSESLFFQTASQYVSSRLHESGISPQYSPIRATDLDHHGHLLTTSQKASRLTLPSVDPYQLPQSTTAHYLIRMYSDYYGTCLNPQAPSDGPSRLRVSNSLGFDFARIKLADIFARAAEAAKHKVPDPTLAVINMCFAVVAQSIAAMSEPASEPLRQAQIWTSIPSMVRSQYGEIQSSSTPPGDLPLEPSIAFFTRAKHLSGLELSMSTSTTAATCLNIMGFYLWSLGMSDSAYEHLGRAARMAMTNRLHRSSDFSSEKDLLYSIFVFDRAIGNTLGMPSLMLTIPFRDATEDTGNVMLYHAKISLASGDLTSEMWRTENTGLNAGKAWLTVVDHALENLNRIVESLPPEVRMVDGISPNRSATMLHLRISEATMAATRPSLFTLLRAKQAKSMSSHPLHPSSYQQVAICLKAARDCINLLRQTVIPQAFFETRLAKVAGFILALGQLCEYTLPEDAQAVGFAVSFLRRTDIPSGRELELLHINIQRIQAIPQAVVAAGLGQLDPRIDPFSQGGIPEMPYGAPHQYWGA